jgi:chromosome segregation ATPase
MPRKGSPPKTDEHLVALRGMWQEMKVLGRRVDRVRTELSARIDQTNERLDATRSDLSVRIDAVRTELSARIDQTNERVDALRGEFARALAESQTRIATELLAVRQVLDTVTTILRQRDADRAALAQLAERVGRLEQRVTP